MHKPNIRPSDAELLTLWESLGSGKFDGYRRGALEAFAGAVAFNVGCLFHTDSETAQGAADNIAQALCRAMYKDVRVDLDSLKAVLIALLDAFGIDRSEIRGSMIEVCDKQQREEVFAWVGEDFFVPLP